MKAIFVALFVVCISNAYTFRRHRFCSIKFKNFLKGDDDFEAEFERRMEQNPLPLQDRKIKNENKLLKGVKGWEMLSRAVVAGVFVAGIGTGITLDSAINTNPKDLASRDAIDRNAPNPKLCANYGSSAMVLDQRVFITFNPFSVYVTQADNKPGCVLRAANVVPLLQEERKLLTDEDIEACKFSYNTWAFVGDINNQPQLNCVWQSDDAQNEFLSNPKIGLGEDVYDKKSNEAADPRVIQSKKQSVSPSAIAAAMAAAAAAGASADQTPAP